MGPQIPMLIGKPRRVKVEKDDEDFYEEGTSEDAEEEDSQVELNFFNINLLKSLKKSTGIVVDVIVNPNVTDLCKENSFFKAQIIDLTLNWIKDETEMEIDLSNKKINHNCDYYGGLGEKKEIPILFTITEEMLQEEEDRNNGVSSKEKKDKNLEKAKAKEKENQNIFDEIRKDKQQNNDSTSPFVTPTDGTNPIEKISSSILLPHQLNGEKVEDLSPQKEEEKKVKKSLIQEIGGDSSSSLTDSLAPSSNLSSNISSSSTNSVEEQLLTERKLVPPSKSEIDRAQDILGQIDPDYQSGDSLTQMNEEMSSKLLSSLSKSLLPDLKLSDIAANLPFSLPTPSSPTSSTPSSSSSHKFQVGERNPFPSSIEFKTEVFFIYPSSIYLFIFIIFYFF